MMDDRSTSRVIAPTSLRDNSHDGDTIISSSCRNFLSTPACLTPPATIAAVEAAAAAAAAAGRGPCDNDINNNGRSSSSSNSSDSGSRENLKNWNNSCGGQLAETHDAATIGGATSTGDAYYPAIASDQQILQEQELRLLLAEINIVSGTPPPPPPPPVTTQNAYVSEGEGVEMAAEAPLAPPPPLSAAPSTAAAEQQDADVDTRKPEEQQDNAPRSFLSGSGGGDDGEGTTATVSNAVISDSHPVLEVYRSIREPLDPMSFEELKRRIRSPAQEDGGGPGSVSELVDFLGVLKRFSEDQHERSKETSNGSSIAAAPVAAAPAAAMAAAPPSQPAASDGEGGAPEGVCGAREGLQQQQQQQREGEVEDDHSEAVERHCRAAAGPPVSAAPSAPGSLPEIILKFTTAADGTQAPSFAVGRDGATVGRGAGNDISIPSDSCMGESDHASILWRGGAFHVEDRGHPFGAAVRIGTGRGLRDWPLEEGSVFSAGNSVFHTTEIDEERGMLLEIVAGPLKGEMRRVHRGGATVGRATDSTISIADRELSRHHSTIECDGSRHLSSCSGSSSSRKGDGTRLDRLSSAEHPGGSNGYGEDSEAGSPGERRGRSDYYLCDVGSTNGTYVQLVGPYASSRRLELSDHILIGRTGFSVNRYDWGVWEDRGSRRTMEDKSVVIQDMGVESLTSLGLAPQTFLAVYDGHGGGEASMFLWQRLHVAIAEALEDASPRIAAAHQRDRAAERLAVFGSGGGGQALRCDDRHGDEDAVSAGSWTPPVFSSSGGGGSGGGGGGGGICMRMSPPPPPTTTATTATTAAVTSQGAVAAAAAEVEVAATKGGEDDAERAPGGKGRPQQESSVGSDEPRSAPTTDDDGGSVGVGEGAARGSKALRWGYDSACPAAGGGVKSSVGRGPTGTQPLSTAPSLPVEWLSEAREMANAVRSSSSNSGSNNGGGGAGNAGSALEVQNSAELELVKGVHPDADADGNVLPAAAAAGAVAGGDAASGVACTDKDGAGGMQGGGGGGQTVDGGTGAGASGSEEGEANGDFGVASPPPSSGSEFQIGAQSLGGGPAGPMPTAGRPAAGGSGGVAHEGGAGGQDRQNVPSAVDKVVEEVVTRAFLATDEEFLTTAQRPSSGSTATTAMVLGDRFYGFNVGDSRTILCRAGRAEVVSKDHKPSREDETERIKGAGGMVIHKRVMGELAVSRAFGDRAFKIGIKAILREEDEHQQGLAHQRELDDGDEDDGLNHSGGGRATTTTTDDFNNNSNSNRDGQGQEEEGGLEESSTADRNLVTMGRGSSLGSGKLLPPSLSGSLAPSAGAAAAAAPPVTAAPQASQAPPAPPATDADIDAVGAVARKETGAVGPKMVTDPTDALITAVPEMLSCRITPEDEFILLACDGLFDVFTTDEVVKIVRRELRRHGDTQRVCETLTRKAIDVRFTQDNVSVVLVVLKKFW
ncbi:unnamed protein product [Pylaiella littoralis]